MRVAAHGIFLSLMSYIWESGRWKNSNDCQPAHIIWHKRQLQGLHRRNRHVLSVGMLIGRRAGLGIAAAAIYVALASWAKFSYVDPTPNGAVAVQLHRPFVWETGFAWRVGPLVSADATRLTDDVVVYEDDRALDRADNFRSLSAV